MKRNNKISYFLALVVFMVVVPIAGYIRESFHGSERVFAYLAMYGLFYIFIKLLHRLLIAKFGED